MSEVEAPLAVLIVEDEYLIASALRLLFERQGARVLGPVAQVATAIELIEATSHIDCALLDVRLEQEAVFPVADELRARGVRFAFMSGYEHSSLPEAYRDATYFDKLADPQVILRWALGAERDD